MLPSLPIELIRHIRSFCDVDTKINMFKAGIDMEPLDKVLCSRVETFIKPHNVIVHDYPESDVNGENFMVLPISKSTTASKYIIRKGIRSTYIVSLMLANEYKEWLGFEQPDGRYEWIEVFFGP
jgi:hypothetical protein